MPPPQLKQQVTNPVLQFSAHLAESHLIHLEKVVKHLIKSTLPEVPGLGRHYWLERIHALDQTYALVISQKQRLSHLQGLLA